ncbi:class I SAM-dependent methyltransferase [Thermosynechococcus sp. HY213]|uniref:class I SAM-dependent methyltransferase n=2 Tax=Thermosynechococcus TaxID=146785 RepID=UPI0028545636|nr:class I SAM-dependent methyltransferase [Thermosynechococcus sp. HY213]MDR7921518.1 class I SAM-dependent methyltransferase [Thermosynechococcus sp. HY213]
MSFNYDPKVVESFGSEWTSFNHLEVSESELEKLFLDYFRIFPWDILPPNAVGFDMGCGTGRWAKFVAPRVGILNCIEPSDAIEVAQSMLRDFHNINFFKTTIDNIDLQANSQDFGYCLGVLHHIPNTLEGIKSCVALLKPKAPFLVYIYYKLDNRPFWYLCLWYMTILPRLFISRLPNKVKIFLTDLIAIAIYFPLARLSYLLEKAGFNVNSLPLSYYRDKTFYTMRVDSRDRFGTPLEKRFSKLEIQHMLEEAGLENIQFSDSPPFWTALGYKKVEIPKFYE